MLVTTRFRTLLAAVGCLILLATTAAAEPGPTPPGYREAWALYRLRYDADALAGVEAYLATRPAKAWEQRALFLRGVLERRAGRHDASIATLQALLARSPSFDDHVRLELVRTLRAAGRAEEGLAAAEALRERHRSFASDRLAVEQSRLLTLLRRDGAAIDAWEKVLDIRNRALPKDDARRELALLYEKTGATDKALEHWTHLVLRMPESVHDREALGHVPLASLDPGKRMQRAELLFKRREYLAAKEAYESVLDDARYRDRAHTMIGTIYSSRLRKDYDKAREHFEAALSAKDKEVAGDALYSLGIVHGKLGQHDDAVRTLRDFRKRFKGDRNWSEAGFEVGRQLMDAGKHREAARALSTWLAGDKNVADRSMYEWFVGWALYRGGFHKDAIAEFAKLAGSRRTLVGDKALYWTARSQDALGLRDKAVATLERLLARFPFTYYSWLAERRLGIWGVETKLADPDFSAKAAWPADPWNATKPKGKRARAALDRLRDLVEIGEIEQARDAWGEVERLLRKDLGKKSYAHLDDAMDPVLERFKTRREARQGAAGKARSKPPSRGTIDDWRDLFPKAYEDLARVVTEREGLPEALLYSHMLQESRYSQYAVSNAPAFGVLQLLQRTARRICTELGIEYDAHDLYDPGTNLRLGAWYLGALDRRFHGQLPLAVASYNGGPKLLSFHIDTHPGLDLETLIEDLPTHQSRNYVRKVLEHYHRYLAIYFPRAVRHEKMAALFAATFDPEYDQEPSY